MDIQQNLVVALSGLQFLMVFPTLFLQSWRQETSNPFNPGKSYGLFDVVIYDCPRVESWPRIYHNVGMRLCLGHVGRRTRQFSWHEYERVLCDDIFKEYCIDTSGGAEYCGAFEDKCNAMGQLWWANRAAAGFAIATCACSFGTALLQFLNYMSKTRPNDEVRKLSIHTTKKTGFLWDARTTRAPQTTPSCQIKRKYVAGSVVLGCACSVLTVAVYGLFSEITFLDIEETDDGRPLRTTSTNGYGAAYWLALVGMVLSLLQMVSFAITFHNLSMERSKHAVLERFKGEARDERALEREMGNSIELVDHRPATAPPGMAPPGGGPYHAAPPAAAAAYAAPPWQPPPGGMQPRPRPPAGQPLPGANVYPAAPPPPGGAYSINY